MTGRCCVTKKKIRECAPRLHPRKPGGKHRRDMLERPGQGKRSAAKKNQHDRLTGGDDSFQQFLLPARQVKPRARSGFTSHERSVFAERQHDHITAFRNADRFPDVVVGRFKNLSAFCQKEPAIRQIARKAHGEA